MCRWRKHEPADLPIFIYALALNGVVRYVGQSSQPIVRFRNHKTSKDGERLRRMFDVRRSTLLILDVAFGRDHSKQLERQWISHITQRGMLANVVGNSRFWGEYEAAKDSNKIEPMDVVFARTRVRRETASV